MGDNRIVIPVILTSILVLAVIAILAPTAVAAPNENANERAKVGMPENVVEIAPGIYSLGKYQVNGDVIEGFLVLHHRPGHEGGPSDEEPPPPDPESRCFAFLKENITWKRPESWLVNPTNTRGLDEAKVLANLTESIGDWEGVEGKNILGNGQQTTDPLELDLIFPTDGVNEVYFGDIVELTAGEVTGAIAGTGVWVRTPPVGDVIIFEWDQIYDDANFDWTFDPDPDDALDQMDFKNIAMHEIGHAMGMGHPPRFEECINETMYYQAGFDEIIKRDLELGDITGIQILY